MSSTDLHQTWIALLSCLDDPTLHDQRAQLIRELLSEEWNGSWDWLPRYASNCASLFFNDRSMFDQICETFVAFGETDDRFAALALRAMQHYRAGTKFSDKEQDALISAVCSQRLSFAYWLFGLFSPQLGCGEGLEERLVAFLSSKEGQNENCGILLTTILSLVSGKPHLADQLLGQECLPVDVVTMAKQGMLCDPGDVVKCMVANWSAGLSSPAVVQRRLKIALCVAGQLRGYQEAHKSWSKLGLEQHELTTFVHVWRHIGRRFPEPGQFDRCFGPEATKALRRAIAIWGWPGVADRLPSVFGWFRQSPEANKEAIAHLYGTQHIVIEPEEGSPPDGMGNPAKMYYKNAACLDFALGESDDFDVVVRLRPDREVHSASGIDWYDIHRQSAAHRKIFVDFGGAVHPSMGYVVGDQFAVSTMEAAKAYCATWRLSLAALQSPMYGMPRQFMISHVNLAMTMLTFGLRADTMKDLIFGRFFDSPPISDTELKNLLEHDLSNVEHDTVTTELKELMRVI